MIPTRFANGDAARARFGTLADTLARALTIGDPLADDVLDAMESLPPGEGTRMLDTALARGISAVSHPPDALRALFAELDTVPAHVDFRWADRGGAVVFRAGILSTMVLGASSLVQGYSSPAGVKPLVMSGRLKQQAYRRLHETARFLIEVCRAGGMRRDAEGFRTTVKVRFMHARVRRMLKRSPQWRAEAWGVPLNQHDMLGTHLMFTIVLLDGLRRLGVRLTTDESEGYMHLWRYVGHVVGVDPSLIPTTEREGLRQADAIIATQGEPDDDSRALVRALLEAPHQGATNRIEALNAVFSVRLGEGLARGLVGGDLADALGVPDTAWKHAVPAVRLLVGPLDSLRRTLPGATWLARTLGERWWDHFTDRALGAHRADFRMPDRLAHAAHEGAHA